MDIPIQKFWCPDCLRAEMDKDFMDRLATVQFGMGEELIINSGFRCETHNKAVGGSPHSKHMLGLAADIKCTDAGKRALLVQLAVVHGMRGIGIAKSFVHFDLRSTPPVLWTYPMTDDEVG